MARPLITKTAEKKFLAGIKRAKKSDDDEKIIEELLNQVIIEYLDKKYGGAEVTGSRHGTDGIISVNSLMSNKRYLIEAKKNEDLSGSKKARSKVIGQVIYYLKKIRDQGEMVPSASVIADYDEIFVLPTSVVAHYLDKDYDWKIAPSSIYGSEIYNDLLADTNIHPHVIAMDSPAFSLNEFLSQMVEIAENDEPVKVIVNTDNLKKLFYKFSFDVMGGPSSPLTNQQQIELFVRYLKGSEDIFLHPHKKNTLYIDSKEVTGIISDRFERYWSNYQTGGYDHNELKDITEIGDTLIEDVDRRFSGDFWTPKIWVDKAHETITDALGENWYKDYVVWDPAAGALNLTRDYLFGDLYSSTLHEEELSIAEDYNREATKFQYDFLNDDMWIHDDSVTRDTIAGMSDEELSEKLKMPVSIIRALQEKKPFVFFANPPYGQPGTGQGKAHKTGSSNTAIGNMMEGLGHARMELYTQFMYRVQLLADLFDYEDDDHFHFFFFNKVFLTSPNFSKFTSELTEDFSFKSGFMLNAGEFSGTSSTWGIIFSHWEVGGTNQNSFTFDVLRSNKELEVEKVSEWSSVMVNKGKTISDWFKEIPIGKNRDLNFPVTRNGLDSPTNNFAVKPREWAIGYVMNDAPNVQHSNKYVGMYSMAAARAHGRDITKDNFTRAAVTFSIRRSVQEDIAKKKELWIRDKDVFTRPSDSLLTPEFIADCVVYSLFDRQSNQTSIRDYEYNGNTYRVVNEFFPFSKEAVNDLAVDNNNLDVQIDLSTDKDRFVYQWLEEHRADISVGAQAVLDEAWSLIEDSFKYRDDYADEVPRYQVNSWDAGWLQINRMIFGNDRATDDFIDRKEEWQRKVRVLGDKIATAAYADGVI